MKFNRYRSKTSKAPKKRSKTVSYRYKRTAGSKIKKLIKTNTSKETFVFTQFLPCVKTVQDEVPVMALGATFTMSTLLDKIYTHSKFPSLKATHTDFGVTSIKFTIIPNNNTAFQSGIGAVGHHAIMLDHRHELVNDRPASLPITMAMNEFAKLRPADKTLKMKFSFRKFLKHMNREDRLAVDASASQRTDYCKDTPFFRIGTLAFIPVQNFNLIPNNTTDNYAILRIVITCDFKGRPK